MVMCNLHLFAIDLTYLSYYSVIVHYYKDEFEKSVAQLKEIIAAERMKKKDS